MATHRERRYNRTMSKGAPKAALRGTDLAYFDVRHAGEVYRVQVKRLASARRLTLRVRAATREAVLTMPPRSSITRAMSFVERHAAWIGARLARLPQPMPFGPGALVPLRGVLHEIVHCPQRRGTAWIEGVDAAAGGPPRLCVGGEAPFLPRRVRDFLLREARADLARSVARHAAALGVRPTRMTLRDTSSRWGSCSSSGALNFSWRLVMAPPHVLDYLAAHEVAHMRHMDHSDAFWSVTAQLVPDYRRAEAWLKAHGTGLMRFGAADPRSAP